MDEKPEGAILQRDKQTYAIVPRIPVGILTPDILEKMAQVARKYKVPAIKITSGQRIAFVGIQPGDVQNAWKELDMQIGPAEGLCVHYVQSCPGNTFCKFGQGDSLGLATRIENMYVGKRDVIPAKTKISFSGCKLNCAESYLRDFGAFATAKGWTILVGGNSGGRPRIGDVLVEDLSEDKAFELLQKCLDYYSKNANPRERMPRFVQRIGIEEFRKAVL